MIHSYLIDKAIEADPREDKLPAWAREKLTIMRRATTESRQELASLKAGTEPGPFWLEGWLGGERFYLPRNAGRLMYGDPAKGAATITLTNHITGGPDGWLCMCADDEISARPWSSNVLLVRPEVGG